MEERKLDKTNKTIRRTVKGSPLLIIVLLAIIIFAVGAVLIQLYMKTVVNVHQVDTDFRGIDAQLMQAGGWGMYTLKNDVTSLVDMMNGPIDANVYATNAAIMVIHSYDLPTEDLTLSVKLYEQGTTTTYAGEWSCTPHLVEFCRTSVGGGDGIIKLGTALTIGKGPWTISHGQIEDMVYDTTAGNDLSTGDDNALILSFTFDGTTDVVYDEGWEGLSDFTTHFDMDVVLSVDDGTGG